MLKGRIKAEAITLVGSIIASLVLVGLLVQLATRIDPLLVFQTMLGGVVGSRLGLEETILRAIPLSLTALAVSLAARMKLLNVGAEGQWASGAFFAAGTALFVVGFFPPILAIPLVILAGMLGGALWALIPALLRAYYEVNEVVSTLLLNYAAIIWVDYLYNGPWRNPKGFGFPGTATFPEQTFLPLVADRLHWGFIVPIVLSIIVALVLYRTKTGMDLRVIGASEANARYLGLRVERYIIGAMLISGAIAGLAGTLQLAGITHKLAMGFNSGYGYSGILVAFIGNLNPLVTVIVAVLMAALSVGGDQAKISLGLPSTISELAQILLVAFLVFGRTFTQQTLRLKEAVDGR